ncbi:amidohydrolase [Microbacterium sp. LWH3-1.2]|uniref:amidohydrolase n=1 Tax=Microbacterium sp. LWH3-1.2 TaxID=3135256 RepID=UPI00344292F0
MSNPPQSRPVLNHVLTNGIVRTSDAALTDGDTVIVRDGRIDWVGKSTDAPDWGELPVVDLGGKTIIPGIIDAHSHPGLVAMSRWHVALPRTEDLDELLAFIREYGQLHPKEEWPYLYFEYYSPTIFGEGGPTKELLDRAISDRPVLCQDAGDHACWVNTRMLEMLGIDQATPDPEPAGLERFVRSASGEPTGLVLENAHVPRLPVMYKALGWSPPEDPTPETITPVLEFLSSKGVVAVFDALIESPEVVDAMVEIDRRGDLPMHYEGAIRFRSMADLPDALNMVRRLDAKRVSERTRVRTVKLFLDGTNELGSSAVLEPLLSDDNSGELGAIQMETDELVGCLELCNRAGIDLHIHMVGDRAFRTGCDAVEQALRSPERADHPWSIQVTFAHCELIDPSDMGRPAELGIILNWTNHWSGGYFGDEAIHHLGEARWNRMYDFNVVADAGAVLTFSSDVVSSAELHRADPFFGMQVAATRVDPETPLDSSRWPAAVRPRADSVLDIDRLLLGYTAHAALQLRIAHEFGTISPGKPAHLVVLDRDPFSTPSSELAQITPTAVVFEGRVVSGAL